MTKKTDARAAQNAIAQALGQHVSYQHRASSAVVNAVNKRLHELVGVLAIELQTLLDDLTPAEMRLFLSGQYRTNRLKKLRDAIKEFGDESCAALAQEWEISAPKLAAYEVGYTAAMMDKVVERMPKLKDTGDAAYKRAMSTPLAGSPPYGGKLVQELLDGFGGANADRVMASLRAGIASGQSNSQLIKSIRGTKALNYQDGVVQIARGDAERFIRTARSHVSNQAMTDVYEQLGVAEVIDVATLDGRTSKHCASIDGRRHKVGTNHPRPPYHPNCRTVQAPALDGDLIGTRPYVRALKVRGRDGESSFRSIGDMTKRQRERAGLSVGQVQASTNYSRWFGNQDTEFQRQWLGKTRYKLYTEGKYSLDRFVDPLSGKQYTLDELRMRDNETFRQIFGD